MNIIHPRPVPADQEVDLPSTEKTVSSSVPINFKSSCRRPVDSTCRRTKFASLAGWSGRGRLNTVLKDSEDMVVFRLVYSWLKRGEISGRIWAKKIASPSSSWNWDDWNSCDITWILTFCWRPAGHDCACKSEQRETYTRFVGRRGCLNADYARDISSINILSQIAQVVT